MATMATIACILYTEDIAEARWVVVVEHEVPEPELAHLLQPLELVLTGNLVLTEALNVVTHGSGTVLALVGSVVLMRFVRHAPRPLSMACAVYAASLLACYLSSTSAVQGSNCRHD